MDRPIIEILKMLLSNMHSYNSHGLCNHANDLRYCGLLSKKEVGLFVGFVDEYMISKGLHLGTYLFDPKDSHSRVEWLRERIIELSRGAGS